VIAVKVFKRAVEAIRAGALIKRESAKDKEFHFQNWFAQRLDELGSPFEVGGRNSYPDFSMVSTPEGFELKGLAYPGRDATFDSNSQMPTGHHNGRDIYYVFGRYPANPDGDEYPIVDLVICHGDFLNADHDYTHKNKSVKRFGSYGDIMIRDRKMYVVPTPFRLIDGAAHRHTLVLPASVDPDDGLVSVGVLMREEARELIVGYTFDLRTNSLLPETIANPRAGEQHPFRAWREPGPGADETVSLLPFDPSDLEVAVGEDDVEN
jgi:hypothetical protein